jgi:hypothetical protein
MLVSAGFTQASDTGQTNPATITAPAGATASQGYEIWRFADTHQAAAPIFIKIEYGSGGAATRPAIYVTVGTSTDGAGTITGTIVLTRTSSIGSQVGGPTSTPVKMYASYDGANGTCMFAWNPAIDSGTNIMGFYVAISRFGDRSGLNAEGWTATMAYSNNSNCGTYQVSNATLTHTTTMFLWTGTGNASTYNTGQYIPMYYCYTWAMGLRWLPGFMGHGISDYAPATVVPVTGLDGVTRNYWIVPSAVQQSNLQGQSAGSGRTALVYQ